jgi:large subunit ribosomal protein L18
MAANVHKRKLSPREQRAARIRKKLSGTTERPRLTIFKSNKHIYAQVIDDTVGTTLAAASSLSPELKGQLDEADKSGAAKLVGKLVAEKAKAANVNLVVFDRNGFPYHGRVAAVADAAREAGLEF